MPLHSEFVTQCVKQITNSIFTTQKYIHDQYWYIGILTFLTNTQDIEVKSTIHPLVNKLIRKANKTDIASEFKIASVLALYR